MQHALEWSTHGDARRRSWQRTSHRCRFTPIFFGEQLACLSSLGLLWPVRKAQVLVRNVHRCEAGDFPAGSYNISVILPHGTAWSNPVESGLFSRDAAGELFQVTLHLKRAFGCNVTRTRFVRL